MDLGKQIKIIEPTPKNYLVEIGVGIVAGLLFLLPAATQVFGDAKIIGLPARYVILVLAVAAVLHGLIKLNLLKKEPAIIFFEKGIGVADFTSTYEDLVVRVKGNTFTFSNQTESITKTISLSKADYREIKSL